MPETPDDQRPIQPQPDSQNAVVPVARPASEGPPKGKIDAKPVFELAEHSCPRCSATMADDAVVCLKCGYDMKANVVRKPEVSVETDPDEGKVAEVTGAPVGGEFVLPGRGSAQAVAIAGGVLTILAMVGAGVFAEPRSFLFITASLALVLYQTALHTGTGVAAVMVAANFCEERFVRPELAVARMFCAFAAFQAVRQIRLPIAVVHTAIPFLLAVGAYFGLVWFLFKRERMIAAIIALCHAILWALVTLGMELSAWVAKSGVAATATTP